MLPERAVCFRWFSVSTQAAAQAKGVNLPGVTSCTLCLRQHSAGKNLHQNDNYYSRSYILVSELASSTARRHQTELNYPTWLTGYRWLR